MSRRDDHISMHQMLDYAREARAIARSHTRADLDSDRMFELALTRLVEIIGEAASRVSPAARESHGEIRWTDIVGMRNRLIHGYDAVDLSLLWGTVEQDLPPLIAALERITEADGDTRQDT